MPADEAAAVITAGAANQNRYLQIFPVAICALTFALALSLDRGAAQWVERVGPLNRQSDLAWVLKLPGIFPVTLLIAIGVGIFHRKSWRMALPLVVIGPLVGLGYTFLKWMVGRQRPILALKPFSLHPFAHGLFGLVHAERGMSFPSGHTAMAFATATCLAAAFPRIAILFFIAAALVGAERILENAHYLSDVVAGAGVGLACGWAALVVSERFIFQLRRDPAGKTLGF